MRRRRTLRLSAALCAALALGVATRPAAAGGMYRHETEHYEVRTDLGPEFAELVGRHMEEMYTEYSRRFRDYGESESEFNVRVFSSRPAYTRAIPPQANGSTGVFVSRGRLLAAHAENRTTEEVLRTLYHEGFHQFMWEVISRNPPAWINEGIAEYFAEATWNGNSFELGIVPTERLVILQRAMREGRLVPFGRLFTMDGDQWIQTMQTDRRRASLYYSQAWSVVQFLAHADGGRHAEMLNRFLKEVSDGADSEEALTKVFGADLAAFRRAWADYVLSLEPSPKFKCRDRMESLLLLAGELYDDPRECRDVSELRRRLQRSRYRWRITRPTGEVIDSGDSEQVNALFHCPLDDEGRRASYAVVTNRRSGMPVLVCNHHPGFVLLAYYERGADGWEVTIEEQVRQTLKPGLRRAIEAAYR